MKNVNENQLKKSIVLSANDYVLLLSRLFDNIIVDINYDGISYDTAYGTEGYGNGITEENVIKELSKYFDVKVSSIHIDDKDLIGVWIVYK